MAMTAARYQVRAMRAHHTPLPRKATIVTYRYTPLHIPLALKATTAYDGYECYDDYDDYDGYECYCGAPSSS
jgi:hypothetical protein